MKVILLTIVAIFLFSLSACTNRIFSNHIAISTKSEATKGLQAIKPIKSGSCDYLFVFIPVRSAPHEIFDALLSEAKLVGGTAVIDVQVNTTDNSFFWFFPPIHRICYEATGTAARFN